MIKYCIQFRKSVICLIAFTALSCALPALSATPKPVQPAELYPLSAVRLLDGPFEQGAEANLSYLLDLEPDRLLSPFLREAGLEPKAPRYGNWESEGLDGHTAGHYLSALAGMVAAGQDNAEGELNRRLDYMLDEIERCQEAYGDGFVGGVPGSKEFWAQIAAGRIQASGFGVNNKWVPWYNVHKTFAGLRDAYEMTGKEKARDILVKLGDWCAELVSHLDDSQMRNMLRAEHGGMLEVMADIYAITGDEKYLEAAERFHDHAVLDPLIQETDRLTGLHANTQIPKVIGLAWMSALKDDSDALKGADFFWHRVTQYRSAAFGGNSVSEHFNDTNDFQRMVESREGPETCNTYNMLRLTEQLFAAKPQASYVDFYERALYNHILASINPETPGFVYFTPLRPQHYRVYSVPENCFWCCVGSGIENPGRYGKFIYAHDHEGGVYVNLFVASELTVSDDCSIVQTTSFPDEASSSLSMKLDAPKTFTLYLRHPAWIPAGKFEVEVNGEAVGLPSEPSTYVEIRREWKNGDTVELTLPMETTVERLPDGSDWVALMHGPIVLAAPTGTENQVGVFADDSRMGHVAHGPQVPLDQVPVLAASAESIPEHVVADAEAGPMHFRIEDIIEPSEDNGMSLIPFFRLHESRYQMYWKLAANENNDAAEERERLAREERMRAAREASTYDSVAVGEQQPEVEHDFKGADTIEILTEGERGRAGRWFQYTLNSQEEKAADLVVTYWGGEESPSFNIFANNVLVATEELTGEQGERFFEKRYRLPSGVLKGATKGRIRVKFVAKSDITGAVYELRIMRPRGNR